MSSIKTIGLISPASACKSSEIVNYQQGIEYLEDLGLKVIVADNVFTAVCDSEDRGEINVAGSAQERLDALYKIWSNKDVDAVITMRGGYGCMHLLDKLDYEFIRANPKPLFGYSDITALQSAIYAKCDLQSFHSPMIGEVYKWQAETKVAFEATLKKLSKSYEYFSERKFWLSFEEMGFANNKLIALNNYKPVNQERLKILGGNLSVIASLVGTEYLPSYKDSVLFLEECNEPKYKVDRMLNHLYLAKTLEGVSAIAVGIPEGVDFAYNIIESSKIPLVKDVPVGHAAINLTVPLG